MSSGRLAELYTLYGPTIYARCRRILGTQAAAEDATQEVFLKVQRHLSKVPANDEALLWIYRVATNHCIGQLRQRRRRGDDGRTSDQPVEAEARTPEAESIDRDLAERLMAHAPAKYRATAWLHFVDGVDQSEVARLLGVTRRTVFNHLSAFLEIAREFVRREP